MMTISFQMVIALISMLFNTIIFYILENIKKIEKRETKGDETLGQTHKFTVLQFISIAILI